MPGSGRYWYHRSKNTTSNITSFEEGNANKAIFGERICMQDAYTQRASLSLYICISRTHISLLWYTHRDKDIGARQEEEVVVEEEEALRRRRRKRSNTALDVYIDSILVLNMYYILTYIRTTCFSYHGLSIYVPNTSASQLGVLLSPADVSLRE